MRIAIKYCRPCGYRERAIRLADSVKAHMNADVDLLPGMFGVFRISVNDQTVFDKRNTRGILGKIGFGTVPSDAELLDRIAAFAETNAGAPPHEKQLSTRR